MSILYFKAGDPLELMVLGLYRGLYESLSKADTEKGKKREPIFDIIAGTSIGAINAAILVSYVVENQNSAPFLHSF